MSKSIESKLKEARQIDHMAKEEIRHKVNYYFNKYGHYSINSPEYKKLVQKIKELGLSLQEAGQYRTHKYRKR